MLLQKTKAYDIPQKVQEMGYYPYFRTIESDQDTVVTINGKRVIMFGSNSYLGLTNHPKIKEASKAAIDKYGSGCAGSRFLNGTLDLHLELEDRLAKFVGKEDALVFSTGFQVNLGTLSSITGRHDYILVDELDHACIIDGTRLSFSKVLKYRHNDMDSLEKALKKCDDDRIKLIAVDGVFSMEGDLAKLDKIVELKNKYNANIFLDDAHGLGVTGPFGQGTASHFGVSDEVDLIMGTFSKSLASIGGFVAADWHTINFLKHNARSLIFSASIAPSNAAAAMAALDILEAEPERLQKLWDNTRFAMQLLNDYGFDTGHTETPIIPIMVRDDFKTFQLTKQLLEEGIFVNPVVSPAVPSSSSLIRFSLMATHTTDQIQEGIDKIHRIGKDIGILDLQNSPA